MFYSSSFLEELKCFITRFISYKFLSLISYYVFTLMSNGIYTCLAKVFHFLSNPVPQVICVPTSIFELNLKLPFYIKPISWIVSSECVSSMFYKELHL